MTSAGMDPTQLPEGLARFVNRPPPAPPGEQCELCAEHLWERHSHLVDLEGRGLLCACRPCYLLFSHTGAGGGRYRQVPDRHLYQPVFAISDPQWDKLAVPVGLAFFFYNSRLEETVAFYPSPGGATESELPLETWADIKAANPEMPEAQADVEALLLRRVEDRRRGADGDAGTEGPHFECYLVPIDACYELVGRVRTHWRGFDGGAEVWRDIDDFFRQRRERSRGVKGSD